MSKYKRGVCPECKVKEGDSSEKTLHQCKLCERWFCAEHFEPRLAFIRDLKAISKYPEVRHSLETEWSIKDGHPDFAYSRKRFEELNVEEKIRSKLIKDALDRSTAYSKKNLRKETTLEEPISKLATIKETSQVSASVKQKCPKCSSERVMITAVREKSDVFECLKCHHKWKHSGRTSEQRIGKRKKPIKKIVAVSTALIILGVFLWYAPTIISTVQNLISQSSYTKVTVVIGQVTIYDHNDNHYVFGYRLLAIDPIDKFYVSSGFQTRAFSVTEGATYNDLGIEIKVSEVHSDYIVLLVKPVY